MNTITGTRDRSTEHRRKTRTGEYHLHYIKFYQIVIAFSVIRQDIKVARFYQFSILDKEIALIVYTSMCDTFTIRKHTQTVRPAHTRTQAHTILSLVTEYDVRHVSPTSKGVLCGGVLLYTCVPRN